MKRSNQTNLRGKFFSAVLTVILFIQCSFSWAQNAREITGSVKDSKGIPLNGARVVIKAPPWALRPTQMGNCPYRFPAPV